MLKIIISFISFIILVRLFGTFISRILKSTAIVIPAHSEILSDVFEMETPVNTDFLKIEGAVTFPKVGFVVLMHSILIRKLIQYNGIYTRRSKINRKYWYEHEEHELYLFCSSYNGNWHIRKVISQTVFKLVFRLVLRGVVFLEPGNSASQ